MSTLIDTLTSDEFMPHAVCLLNEPGLVWLHAVSDSLIALAYYGIPVVVIYFAWRRADLVFKHVFLLSGAFVLACGTTHLMAVWTLWSPDYLADGLIKAATAAISLISLLAMWQVMPQALAFPSPTQLREANAALGREVEVRQAAEKRIRELNRDLENRVRDRTAELEQANAQLRRKVEQEALLLREVHHRVKNNLQMISSILSLQAGASDRAVREPFRIAQQRIAVMARMHEEFHVAESVRGLRMDQYLRELCTDLTTLYGVHDRVDFAIDAEPLSFDLDVATPLALILNEAITNACKHAFPDNRDGTVHISLHRVEGIVKASVCDNGVGLPEEKEDRKLGSVLIETFAQQLEAELTWRVDGGTCVEVRFEDPGFRS